MKRLASAVIYSVVAITLAVFLPFFNADACTRIFWNTNGQSMLVARTMDLSQDDQVTLYVFPRGTSKNGGADVNPATWTSKYGSVVMTFGGSPDYCSEGINTSGLAFHYLYLDGTEYERRDTRPGVLGGIYGQYLLDNAATVEEALNLMYQTQLVPEEMGGIVWPIHLAMEDAQGNSAVVEFVGGRMNVYHGAEYTVLTNEPTLDQQIPNLMQYKYFGGALPLPGDVDSMSRFVRASAFLSTLNLPSLTPDPISRLFSAIRSVSTPFGALEYDSTSPEPAWPTLWTSLFDLTNKAVYFTHSMARNNFWINMRKLNFSKRAPVLYLKAYRHDLAGEVSRSFRVIRK